MNLEQANRLVKLAQYLETVPNSKWDYGIIREERGQIKVNGGVKLDCGSVACALGHCPSVFPAKFLATLNKEDAEFTEDGDINVPVTVSFKKKNGDKIDASQFRYSWETERDSGDLAMDFFGLSSEEFKETFLGYNSDKVYNCSDYGDVPKGKVIAQLYKLVKKYGFEIV